MRIEQVILKNLIKDQNYTRRVIPFLKEEYFHEDADRIVFKKVKEFVDKYNVPPHINSLLVEIDSTSGASESSINKGKSILKDIQSDDEDTDFEWAVDQTEKFCQEKDIYNAIMKSIDILNGKDKTAKGAIPALLESALSISFDPSIGHNYNDDYEERYEHYHKIEDKIPFDLEYFNKITKGGLKKKTMNVIMGPTGGGKSLMLCHFAASFINAGKNVLYITLEMAEEEIAKRIDTNIMNVSADDLLGLPRESYIKRAESFKTKATGKLFIKEYPTASAGAGHFKALLGELRLKKKFKADVIIVDYLNICCSMRLKNSGDLYQYVKSIAEELRGLAVEEDVVLLSATQVNRTGYMSSDVGLENTSESFGLPATCDLMLAIIISEELEKLGQVVIKQLKNRYNDPTQTKRFAIGVDRSKMRLYDVEGFVQDDIVDSGKSNRKSKANTTTPSVSSTTEDKFAGIIV